MILAGNIFYHCEFSRDSKRVYDGADMWNYNYDYEDRFLAVRPNGTVENRFWYDAHGRRIRLWDSQNGYVTHVYSGLNIIFENSSSSCTKHFYANGLHIAENRSGTVEYFHQDHLGSTRLRTNSSGGVVFQSNYLPFGPSIDRW